MKALIFGGPGQRSWESTADPGISEPTDVVVKVDTTTICGTDLHILKGDVPAVTEGRVLGHEAVGTVVETGAAVSSLKKGDRVLVPAITSCGRCGPCKRGMAAHCEAVGGIGWIFGHLIDGVQSEYARVPYAETSVHLVPEGVSDEQVLFLADILPTGFEIGVQNGGVAPGDTVAVVGAGPVGLAAMMTGAIAGAGRIIAVDVAESRLKHAPKFGATHTVVAGEDAEAQIGEITGGEGVDVAMEAVGVPGDLRPLHAHREGGRNRREHRRARRAHDAAPRGALDQEHHHHHRPGQRLDDSDAALARARRQDPGRPARHPSVQARRDHGRLRRVRRRRRERRAEGGPDGELAPLRAASHRSREAVAQREPQCDGDERRPRERADSEAREPRRAEALVGRLAARIRGGRAGERDSPGAGFVPAIATP